MAKYDGIKGYILLEIEKGVNDVTLVFRDNRYLFVTSTSEVSVQDEGVEGQELDTIQEEAQGVALNFKNGKKLKIWSGDGVTTESVPE
jgi:hypothetical protein